MANVAVSRAREAPELSLREREPLTIEVRAGDDGALHFALVEESIQRLRDQNALPPNWRPHRVNIDDGTLDDFLTRASSALAQLAMLVSGLDEMTLLAFGGVQFVREDGVRVAAWPPRRA